jgi:hypothetical protein
MVDGGWWMVSGGGGSWMVGETRAIDQSTTIHTIHDPPTTI